MCELTIGLVTPSLVLYEPQTRNDQMIAMVVTSTILEGYLLASASRAANCAGFHLVLC
jgi:hypothetical protein